jgi:phosphoglycerol transferase
VTAPETAVQPAAARTEQTPEAHRSPAPRTAVRRSLVGVLPYAVAALVSLAAALWTYRPWLLGRAIMVPAGDALAFHAWIRNTVETGWYEVGTRLAAPYVQNNHPYSVTDELVFAAIGKVLVPLLGGVGPAVTLWVVLSFPFAAIAAVGVARHLRIGAAASVVIGVAFALLPDHFIRGTGHFSLATSWVIPLGVLGALSLVHPPRVTGRRRVLFEVAILAGLVAVSLVNAYYAVFSGFLVAAAGIGGAVLLRSWRVLLTTAARGLALVVPLAVSLVLDRLYLPSPQGYDSFAATRSLADAEVYGGKISAMLLPASAHRFTVLRDIRTAYDTIFPNPAEGAALGLVATLGFLGLVCWAVLSYWRRDTDVGDPRLRSLAALTWVGLFVFVVGGVGTVWALLLDGGGMRVWSRMHVFLALLALLALGIALDRVRRAGVRAGLVVALTAVAVVDQTSPVYQPDFGFAARTRADVTALTAAIEERTDAGAMVYQYPHVSFPVPNRTTAPASPYDGFLPYLHSGDVRWSYGGLQGDPTADWQLALGTRPLAEQLALLGAAGFAGVLVDGSTLAGTPEQAAEVVATLGGADVGSADGRWGYHDLPAEGVTCPAGGETARDELADAAVRPPLLYPGEGVDATAGVYSNAEGPGALRVVTLRDGGWPSVTVSFTVDSPTAPLTVAWPDGTEQRLPAGRSTPTWTGPATGQETTLDLRRTEGEGRYTVSDLAATPTLSPEAASCLAAAAAAVRPGG